MKGVLVHKGDTIGLYPEYLVERRRYFSYRFPKFPEYVVASTEDPQENEKLYAYQKKVWLQLDWHGSQSKHQTHYQWCLNSMIRNGAYLHVRQYSRDIDPTRGRIQVVYIRSRAANSCNLSYVDPYDETKIDGKCSVVGLDASDYRLSLCAGSTNKADVFYNNPRIARSVGGHEMWWDKLPAWGNDEDPQQPFGKTIEDQCVWLHRLCQISPGAITLNNKFKVYGAWLEEGDKLVVAGHEGERRSLQKKVLPLDTTFEACCPCRSGYNIDSDYQAFRK